MLGFWVFMVVIEVMSGILCCTCTTSVRLCLCVNWDEPMGGPSPPGLNFFFLLIIFFIFIVGPSSFKILGPLLLQSAKPT